MKTKLGGNILLLVTALVWGISFVSQSVGMEYVEPNTFNGIRTLLGGIVLLPVIFFLDKTKKEKGTYLPTNKKKLFLYGGICGVFLCVASTLQTYGMNGNFGFSAITTGESGFLTALYIIFVAILGAFSGKKLSAKIILGVMLSMVGMYFLCLFGTSISLSIGHFLTFLCAIIFALHILVIDKFSPEVDGVKLSCTQFFVAGTLNLIVMCFFETPSLSAIFSCVPALLYSGVMSCGVAYTLQIIGQKYTDPTSASILMSLESVFSALAGWVLLGQSMTLFQILGCGLMFAAIVLVQLPDKKRILQEVHAGEKI